MTKIIDKIFASAICFILCLVSANTLYEHFTIADKSVGIESDNVLSYDEKLKEMFGSELWMKSSWINLNGYVSKWLHVKSMYKSDNVIVGSNGYVFGAYKRTSTDYEYEQTVSFAEWLREKDIPLLYVNEPIKYTDDEVTSKEFGLKSYGNTNADVFLSRIREDGISVIDLREIMAEDNINSWDLFYRTDHHWTVPAGFWAGTNIASWIGDNTDIAVDMSLYDSDNYKYHVYENAWLGEQGRRVAVSYTGLDDYTSIMPEFQTDFTVIYPDGSYEMGDFGILVDESIFNTANDPYEGRTWHSAYMPSGNNGTTIINNDKEDGHILYLGDSYDNVVVPFLALNAHEVDTYILRATSESVRDIVENGDYDLVIVAYAQFMIGAHDDETNANYAMFDFE